MTRGRDAPRLLDGSSESVVIGAFVRMTFADIGPSPFCPKAIITGCHKQPLSFGFIPNLPGDP